MIEPNDLNFMWSKEAVSYSELYFQLLCMNDLPTEQKKLMMSLGNYIRERADYMRKVMEMQRESIDENLPGP